MTKVLLVDDDDDKLFIRKMYLESEGFVIFTENDGRKAVDLAKKERPDLIISDIQMPEFDGFDLCKTIRSDDEIKETPLILITSAYQELNTNLLKILNLGANDYIVDPINKDELLFRINKLLNVTK